MQEQIKTFRLGQLAAMLLAMWLCFCVSARLQAQVAGATLSGVVSDAKGAVIPGATVSIQNVATGVSREATTNGDGFYSAPNLLPGMYQVRVTSSG